MANIEICWTKTDQPIRINDYARRLGFDLRAIEQNSIPDDHWNWIDNKIRNSILRTISNCWENDEWAPGLSEVDQGIYTITLADNLSIDYNGNASPVIYVGRGQILKRISSHLKEWIRYFSESLQGISFDIWMTEIKVKGNEDAFKDVETDLLNYFFQKYSCYPINNSKGGRCHQREHQYNKDWNKPLWNPRSISSGWCIKPLKNNWWAIEFEDTDE